MKDYQSKAYDLPHDVYMQTLWFIRGYKRRQVEADAILYASPAPPDGMPKGSGTSDPVSSKASKRECLLDKNKMIDDALSIIPEEYREAIFANVAYRVPYPNFADRTTYSRWRVRFITAVAEKMDRG